MSNTEKALRELINRNALYNQDGSVNVWIKTDAEGTVFFVRETAGGLKYLFVDSDGFQYGWLPHYVKGETSSRTGDLNEMCDLLLTKNSII